MYASVTKGFTFSGGSDGVEEGVRERPGHITCCLPPSGAVKEPVQDEFQSCFESAERRRVGERQYNVTTLIRNAWRAIKGLLALELKDAYKSTSTGGEEGRITKHVQLRRVRMEREGEDCRYMPKLGLSVCVCLASLLFLVSRGERHRAVGQKDFLITTSAHNGCLYPNNDSPCQDHLLSSSMRPQI